MLADDLKARMWSEACDMLQRAEQRRREFFFWSASAVPQGGAWEPPVDIFETDDRLWIVAAVPGVEPEHIEASIKGNELSISGSRPLPALVRRAAIHRLEIPYGRFERRLRLPPGRFESVGSDLIGGCLVLSLIRRS